MQWWTVVLKTFTKLPKPALRLNYDIIMLKTVWKKEKEKPTVTKQFINKTFIQV